MKSMLITGGAGFIGSNFVKHMMSKHPQYTYIIVDSLTYAGNMENLADVVELPNFIFIRGDVGDRKLVNRVFCEHPITYVVNFAAESHVDRSIEEPDIFLVTNTIGTQVLLDVAKNCWKINPEDKHCRLFRTGVKFLQVSTVEVYGSLGPSGAFHELMPLQPNSPYSASKASADLVVRAYHETFGIPVSITRCSNNYGPYQFPEKLIPLMINNALRDKQLPIYGDGQQVRDWIHVHDHCTALEMVLLHGSDGEIYNIGGSCERTNLQVVIEILDIVGKSTKLILINTTN